MFQEWRLGYGTYCTQECFKAARSVISGGVRSALTADQVRSIRAEAALVSDRDLADRHNVHVKTIRRILRGTTYQGIT